MTSIKRTVSILLAVMMVFGMFTTLPFAASAAAEVSYRQASYNGSTVSFATKSVTSYTNISASTTSWTNGGWYVAKGTVSIGSVITVSGTANLILTDGCNLTAGQGIVVNNGNTLNIFAQSGNTGSLVSNAINASAGIGSTQNSNSGSINIHGGTISAKGSVMGAGIGGGRYSPGFVTIYGGNITATGGHEGTYNKVETTGGGAGIGNGGYQAKGGTVSILGGTVNATGEKWAAGIGCGSRQGTFTSITIKNATVTARGGLKGAGIGGGSTNYDLGSIVIENSTVIGIGGDYAVGIGHGGGDSNGTLTVGDNLNVYYGGNADSLNHAHLTNGDYARGSYMRVDNSKPTLKVSKAPTPVTSNYYDGSAHDLVTPGVVKCGNNTYGTMLYAVGTNATTAPTSGWSTTIPSRKNIGTYYVWYKAQSDTHHNESATGCVTAYIYQEYYKAILEASENGGTASLLKTSFEPWNSADKVKAGDKIALRINPDEDYTCTVALSMGGIENLTEFTEEEYQDYIEYARANNIYVPSSTIMVWVTMPKVASEYLTVSVNFVKPKQYTIFYKTSGNPNEVWCKFVTNGATQVADVTKMVKDTSLGNGTVLFSLAVMAGSAPAKIAFGTSKSAVEAVSIANMTNVSAIQTTPIWSDITDGQYCVIGGEAKTFIVAFVSDGSIMSVYKDSSATFDAGTNSNGAEYQIAICPADSHGNVTADGTVTVPDAPTKSGYAFDGWRGFEGTAPNKTEKIYQPGESISVRENTTLNAVWNKTNLNITLNLNGGTGGSNVTSVAYNTKLTIAQNPTKKGNSFNGWTVTEDVTQNGEYFAKGTAFDLNTPITADLKLKAKWKHIHSYTAFRISSFPALSAYNQYDSLGHISVCGCDDIKLVAHEFNSSGKCACGYQKPDPTATLDISYGQWSNGTYTEKMKEFTKTVKKGQRVSIDAPAYYGSLKFSKWQYTTGGAWTDLSTSPSGSFAVPRNIKLRALYIDDPITTPQVEISAHSYDDSAVYDGQTYVLKNILFNMSYKLPDNCTFVTGGIRLGDNNGISYYKEKRKQYVTDSDSYFWKGVVLALNIFDDNKPIYYEERENSVLKDYSAATVAKCMYESKPINVPKYEPIYWNATIKNKANNGTIGVCPPVRFAQRNDGKHYIYGIGWLRYKDNKGNTKTIYTDALAGTIDKIPTNTLVKKGAATRGLSVASSGASAIDLTGSGDTPVDESNAVVDTIFSDNTQLNVYVDGEWSGELSDEYGCGDTATVTAPAVDGKTFSHWEADGSVISYNSTLKLTMNAHTDLYAVYADAPSTELPFVGFTSITRTSDGENISFQAIASDTNAGIIYSTTADGDDLVIGGSGVTNVPAEQLTDDSTTMPASVIDDNNCWTLQITPDNADTVYHARAYVTVDGVTTYGDVKDIKLSELQNGVTSIANVDGYFVENPLSEALKGLLGTDLHTITWNNEDGSEIDQTVVVDGDTPTHADMTKPEDILFTYDLIGWTDSNNNFYAKDTDLPVATDAETYTATFESTRKDYFAGHSITLKGDIGVYFYLRLSDEEAANTTLTFSWKDNTLENVPVELDPNGTGFYRAECPVAVAEMTCPITAVATINGDVKDETNVYSVRDYADVILSDKFKNDYTGTGSKSYENLETLVKAMLDYGAKAQAEFDVLTDNLANAGIDFTPAEVNAADITGSYEPMSIEKMEQSGLHYVGTSVVYLSKTSLRHYFTVTDAAKFDEIKDSITFDSVKAESTEKGNFIYFELKDITAFDLNTAYTFTAGGESMDYSVMDFVKQVLAEENTPATDKALAAATYTYNQAAAVYFANVQ